MYIVLKYPSTVQSYINNNLWSWVQKLNDLVCFQHIINTFSIQRSAFLSSSALSILPYQKGMYTQCLNYFKNVYVNATKLVHQNDIENINRDCPFKTAGFLSGEEC